MIPRAEMGSCPGPSRARRRRATRRAARFGRFLLGAGLCLIIGIMSTFSPSPQAGAHGAQSSAWVTPCSTDVHRGQRTERAESTRRWLQLDPPADPDGCVPGSQAERRLTERISDIRHVRGDRRASGNPRGRTGPLGRQCSLQRYDPAIPRYPAVGGRLAAFDEVRSCRPRTGP